MIIRSRSCIIVMRKSNSATFITAGVRYCTSIHVFMDISIMQHQKLLPWKPLVVALGNQASFPWCPGKNHHDKPLEKEHQGHSWYQKLHQCILTLVWSFALELRW